MIPTKNAPTWAVGALVGCHGKGLRRHGAPSRPYRKYISAARHICRSAHDHSMSRANRQALNGLLGRYHRTCCAWYCWPIDAQQQVDSRRRIVVGYGHRPRTED